MLLGVDVPAPALGLLVSSSLISVLISGSGILLAIFYCLLSGSVGVRLG